MGELDVIPVLELERVNVPESWVREHTRNGRIPHIQFGRYVRYDQADIEDWVASLRGPDYPFRRYFPREVGSDD